jgi:hypothetical protein
MLTVISGHISKLPFCVVFATFWAPKAGLLNRAPARKIENVAKAAVEIADLKPNDKRTLVLM